MSSQKELDFSLLKSQYFLKSPDSNKYTIKNIKDAINNKELVPFYLLFKYIKESLKGKKREDFEDIITKYIIDEELSVRYLNMLIDEYDIKDIQNHYDTFYSILKFSLSNEQKKKFIQYTSDEIRKNTKDIWFSQCSIIDNFIDLICFIEKSMNIKERTKADAIKIIDEKINYLLEIFYIDFNEFNYPPINHNHNYIYNYYFREFIYAISLFQKKRDDEIYKIIYNNPYHKDNSQHKDNIFYKVNPHHNNNNRYIKYKSLEEKYDSYLKLNKFLCYFKPMIFNDNKDKNYIKLKIMNFYLYLYEEKRDFCLINSNLLKQVIKSLNSEPISNSLLNKYHIYQTNESEPITEEIWGKLTYQDFIHIKSNYFNLTTNIKSFNSDILSLDDDDFSDCIKNRKIEYTNFYGLFMNNYIKIDSAIEEQFKNILFRILQSDKCEEIIKNDERFSNYKYVFKSRFAKEIFDEIWKYIYIIPIPFKNLYGTTMRNEYSIFINNVNIKEDNPLVIIPILHALMNDIYHEIFHSIWLLYCSVFDLNKELIPTKVDENLVNIQEGIKKKYQLKNEIIINKFIDMGDYMEVSYYGIKPKCFCTYSSLFFFSNQKLSKELFQQKYYQLFNLPLTLKKSDVFYDLYLGDNELDKKQESKIICLDENKEEADNKEIQKNAENKILKNEIIGLFNIKIMRELMKVFKINNNQIINNKGYIHSNLYREETDNIINMSFIREGNCFVSWKGFHYS